MKKTLLTFCLMLCSAFLLQAATNELLHADFENGMPAGWTQEYVSLPITAGYDTVAFSWGVEQAVEGGADLAFPTGAYAGTGRAFARNSSPDEMRFVTRLVSPVINMQGVFQPQLVFSHAEVARSGASDTLKVYYRTSATDYWHLIPNATYARNAAWRQEILPAVGANRTYQIAFEITENFGRGVVLDDVILRATPTCQNVTDIVSTNVHAYDALLAWNANGAYNEFEVMLSETPITDFSNIDPTSVRLIEHIYNPEYQLTNLTPSTDYYVYVRSDCDENESGYTAWVGAQFRTLKVAFLPYTENFNSAIAMTGNVSYGMAEGWITGTSLDVQVPFVYRAASLNDRAAYSVDSTAFLAFVGDLSAAPTPLSKGAWAYAATPEIVTESLQGLEVDFWATAHDKISRGTQTYAAELIVGTMSDPANSRTFTPLDTLKIETSYQFKHFTVSLANYTGTDKFVALMSKSAELNEILVDNFSMKKPGVFVPTHVQVNGVKSTGFNVHVDMNGADSWNLVVSTEYSRTGVVSPGSILYSATGLTSPSAAVLPTTAIAGEVVMVYAQAVKNGVTSAWSFPVTLRVPTQMQVPYVNSCEPSAGQIQLKKLNNEVRTSSTLQAMSNVFFPVTAISDDVRNAPTLSSVQPNYRSAHVVLEGVDSWFVLPEVENLTTLKMTFRYATEQGKRGKIAVGVMSDPYDLSTFEQIATFSTSDMTYRRGLLSFDVYQGTGKFIAFRSLNANQAVVGSTFLIDDIRVEELGNCREASNVQASVRSHEATITWNGGNMDGWIVGISTSNTMLNATYTTVTQPTFTFTNLESESQYFYTIQTICGDDTLDLDDVYYDFRTPRGFPFEEKFATTSMPAGWTRGSGLISNVFNGGAITTTTSGWTITSSTSRVFPPQSGNAAYVNVYGTGCRYWLMSPVLNLEDESIEALELSFDVAASSYSSVQAGGSDDKFGVLVSVDGGNTWSRANATLWTNDGTGDYVYDDLPFSTAQKINVDFTKFLGQTIQFAFYGESTSSNADVYVSVDNISLHVADPDCGGLSNLRVAPSTDGSMRVSWNLAGVQPYPAIVEVSKSATFAQVLSSDTIQGTNLMLNNLESSQHYYVRARQNCPAGSEWLTADFRTPCEAVAPLTYFESFDAASSIDCWTTGFVYQNGNETKPGFSNATGFGGVLRISKESVAEGASDGAYAISPEFQVGDTISKYQVVFSAGSKASSSTAAATNVKRLTVGIVTDPSDVGNREIITTLNLAEANDSLDLKTYVVSFEDYEGDLDGYYGHYVVFIAEAGADSTDFIYIDNVSIELAQACRQVLDLSADSIKVDGARLFWTGNADTYEVAVSDHYMRADTASANDFIYHETIEGNSTHVTGLQATTEYFAFVRSHCGEDSARWSSATRFKTSYGAPFLEVFGENSITDGTWSSKSYLFQGDSVLGANFAQASGLTAWSIKDCSTSGIANIVDYAVKANVYSTTTRSWLISPVIDLSTAGEAELKMSFRAAWTKYNNYTTAPASAPDDRIGVLVSTDDGATWYAKDATFWPLEGTLGIVGKTLTKDLTDYAGKSIRVAIYGESTVSNGDNDLFIDSIRIEKFEAICLGARQLALTLQDDHTALATWNIHGTPDSVALELATDEQFTNVLRRDTTDAEQFVYTDLEYSKTYYVRATQLGCTTSNVASVSTKFALPYAETFTGATLPANWTVMTGNVYAAFNDTLPQVSTSTTAWKVATNNNGLPANHLLGELYKQASQNEKWIVSPEIFVNANSEDEVALMFDMALTGHNKATAATSADDQEFRVLISKDNGASWNEEDSWVFANTADAFHDLASLSATGQRISIPMNDYIGESVRVALYKGSTHATNDNDLHIANLIFRTTSDMCADPDSLQAATVGFTNATIQWQGVENKTTVVEYATLEDFSNAQTDTIQNVLTHTLNGLQPATTYYVRVKTICASNSESGYSNVLTFATSVGLPYAQPFAAIGDWTRWKAALVNTPTFTTTTYGWQPSTATAILGKNHIYCTRPSTSTPNYWIMSPEIDLTPNTTEEVIALTFDMALTKSNSSAEAPTASDMTSNLAAQHFHVAISTDNGVTWLPENTWTWSQGDTAQFAYSDIPAGAGKNYQLDVTRFGGQKIRVAFVAGGAAKGGFVINIANFKVDALTSSCFGVSNVTVSQIDTAATLTITPNDNAQQWEVAYGKQGTELSAMRTQPTSALQVRVGGLALNSTYEVYARSICAEGDTSAWTGPFSFVTPLGLTYEEAFRGTLSDWTRYTGIPDSIYNGKALTATTSGWTASNSSVVLGEPHVYCAKSTSAYNWLVSPVINLMPQKGDKNIYLSLDMAVTSSATAATAPTTTNGHTFRIAISEDGGQTWSANNTILFGGNNDEYQYASIPAAGRAYHFDVTKYAGKVIRIALIEGMASSGTSYISVNDLELAEYDVPCFGVASLTAAYNHGVAECAILPGDSATAWQYTFGKAGFVPSNLNAFNVDTTHFNIGNLPMSSTIDIYVRSLCGTSDTSAWFGPVQVKTPLGIRYEEALNGSSFPTGWTEYEFSSTSKKFNSVTSNLWYVGSGKNTEAFGANHAYINAFSSRKEMLASPQIELGNTGGNLIQLSFDLALTQYNQNVAPTSVAGQSFEVRVSVDNGKTWDAPVAIWSDESNQADYSYSGIPAAGANYTVDLTDYAGEAIRVGFYTISTGGGCDNDVHFRNVVIDTISGSVCMPISRIALLDSTYNTITVSLRAPGIDNAEDIEYVCQPQYAIFNAGLAQHADTNIITVSGLSSSTGYNFFARLKCPEGNWTNWVGPYLFHTVECSPVTGIASSTLSLTDARIELATANAAAATGYQLYVTELGGVLNESEAMASKSNVFAFTYDFEPSAAYDVYARKICQPGDTSEWVGPMKIVAPVGDLGDVIYSNDLNGSGKPADWMEYTTTSSNPGPTDFSVSTSTLWTVGSSRNTCAFGTNHAYTNAYSTNKAMLVTEQIDLSTVTTTGAVLSFDLALTKYNSSAAATNVSYSAFEVRVSNDNGTTWDLIANWGDTGADYLYSEIPNDNGATYQLPISQYVGQTIRVGFYSQHTASAGDNDIHLANVAIYQSGSERGDDIEVCSGIATASVDNVALNQATLHFTYKDNVDAADMLAYYEVSTANNFATIVKADTVRGTTTEVMTGLLPSTTYYVRVKQICSATSESNWSRSVSFTTALGIRYYEDFEDPARVTRDWKIRSGLASTIFAGGSLTTTTSGWSRKTLSDPSSNVMDGAFMNANIWSTSSNYWVVSPTIDLSINQGQALLFAFDVATADYSSSSNTSPADPAPDDQFIVAVSLDGGRTFLRQNAFVWNNLTTPDPQRQGTYDGLSVSGQNPAPHRIMLDFSRFAGQTVTVGFYGESTVSNGDNNLFFDNIDFNAVTSVTYADTICQFADYAEHGFEYAAEELNVGMNQFSIISQNFDTITNLTIYVKPQASTQLTARICEGEIYTENGFNLAATTSGTYKRIVPTADGCDSIVYLNLTVDPIQRQRVDIDGCAGSSITIGGNQYYNSTVVRDTLSSTVTGCDSITTYYLTFSAHAKLHTDTTVVLCAGETYNDGLFNVKAQGTYTKTTNSYQGCDSTVVLHIFNADLQGAVYDTVLVENLPYVFAGKELIPAGGDVKDYDFEVETSCGTKATLHVNVTRETALEDLFVNGRGAKKVFIDGHIYIVLDGVWYDATGRRVE